MSMQAQTLEFKLYSKSLQQIEEKNYHGALKTMDRYFRFFFDSPRMPEMYCNRALVNIELKQYNAAIDDYVNAMNYDSSNHDIYKLRGQLYAKLNKHALALKDFDHAIRLDSSLGECYAAKADIYLAEKENDLACAFETLALKHGYYKALEYISKNCDTNSMVVQRYLLRVLDERSTDSDYGYSEYKPIKVGGNSIERLEQYLSMLRDRRGYPISYKHISNCCPYKSTYGAFGKGLCDTYEVMIGEERRILYLSMYDYDDARIPVGLYSTFHFKE